jgi:hypothetical protein
MKQKLTRIILQAKYDKDSNDMSGLEAPTGNEVGDVRYHLKLTFLKDGKTLSFGYKNSPQMLIIAIKCYELISSILQQTGELCIQTTVILMNNTSYHSVIVDKTLASNDKMVIVVAWTTRKGNSSWCWCN